MSEIGIDIEVTPPMTWPEDIETGAKRGAIAVARVELAELKREAPAESGALRRSMQLRLAARDPLVFSDSPYALAQDARGPHRGYIERAINQAHTKAESAFAFAVDEALR